MIQQWSIRSVIGWQGVGLLFKMVSWKIRGSASGNKPLHFCEGDVLYFVQHNHLVATTCLLHFVRSRPRIVTTPSSFPPSFKALRGKYRKSLLPCYHRDKMRRRAWSPSYFRRWQSRHRDEHGYAWFASYLSWEAYPDNSPHFQGSSETAWGNGAK